MKSNWQSANRNPPKYSEQVLLWVMRGKRQLMIAGYREKTDNQGDHYNDKHGIRVIDDVLLWHPYPPKPTDKELTTLMQ